MNNDKSNSVFHAALPVYAGLVVTAVAVVVCAGPSRDRSSDLEAQLTSSHASVQRLYTCIEGYRSVLQRIPGYAEAGCEREYDPERELICLTEVVENLRQKNIELSR